MNENERRDGKLPTALVLAATSMMLTVGAASFAHSHVGCAPPAAGPAELQVLVRDQSPSEAAESYLDAWRKRRFDIAAELAIGDARKQADTRSQSEAKMREQAGSVAEIWRKLAGERLRYVVDETHYDGDDRVMLRGTAEGTFGDRRYAREVDFTVARDGEHWRVANMVLGRVRTGSADASASTDDR